MSDIQEARVNDANTEEIRIDNRVQLTKVYVGGGGDYIVVSGNDISIFGRFCAAGDELIALAEEMENKESEADEPDYKKEIESRKYFSDKATAIMDGVFGEGTTRKFFSDVYAAIPNFQPDLECFLDFWDSLIPVIERLSEHKVKLEKLASKQRMEKYHPQDRKKSGKKAYAKAGTPVYAIADDKS